MSEETPQTKEVVTSSAGRTNVPEVRKTKAKPKQMFVLPIMCIRITLVLVSLAAQVFDFHDERRYTPSQAKSCDPSESGSAKKSVAFTLTQIQETV
ncbi:hypothetical protein DIPPA_25367 [Diplonema papillatum]|nr:hypothetical protein DIPPA_25367 [Diplonema papillatum]